MKHILKSDLQFAKENVINVTMYLYPEIYSDFKDVINTVTIDVVEAAASFDEVKKRYHTDVNPARIINGPLSDYGQDLENPIKGEYEEFKRDCLWLVKELGFTVIKQQTSTSSKKSEYIILFGIDDTPCGTLVYDLRISDHPFDAKFPEELKDAALEYLKMNNVLKGNATKAGIDFVVEKITVGTSRSDTWDKAYNRLYILLKRMKKDVKTRLKTRGDE